MPPIVLAMTGASGSIYALRLLDVLLTTGSDVHLTISPAAAQVFLQELELPLEVDSFDIQAWRSTIPGVAEFPRYPQVGSRGLLTYHHYRDFSAGIASGSFATAGMVICPCSMGTLAGVAHGLSTNLIQRAADVHLKERRELIVVPRETPLGVIPLQNMAILAQAGAIILPAMPAYYHRPRSIADLVDFIVGRICDQLGIQIELFHRWGEPFAADND